MTNLYNNKPTGLSCPECGTKDARIYKYNTKTGRFFLGCRRWPYCKWTQDLPDELRTREDKPTYTFDVRDNDDND